MTWIFLVHMKNGSARGNKIFKCFFIAVVEFIMNTNTSSVIKTKWIGKKCTLMNTTNLFKMSRNQRSYQRLKEFIKWKWSSGLFWADGAAEKKTPNRHKYATFWGGFLMFSRSKNTFKKIWKCFFAHKKLKNPPEKVAYLWQFRDFFSSAPTAQNSPELHFHFINIPVL